MGKRPEIGVVLAIRRGDKVLLQKRKGRHAPGTFALPGGHLEMFETFEECALRELKEEAGKKLKVSNIRYWATTNDRYYDEAKHVVTISMICDWVSGEAVVMEPHKCEFYVWSKWDDMPSPLMPCLKDLVQRKLNPFLM